MERFGWVIIAAVCCLHAGLAVCVADDTPIAFKKVSPPYDLVAKGTLRLRASVPYSNIDYLVLLPASDISEDPFLDFWQQQAKWYTPEQDTRLSVAVSHGGKIIAEQQVTKVFKSNYDATSGTYAFSTLVQNLEAAPEEIFLKRSGKEILIVRPTKRPLPSAQLIRQEKTGSNIRTGFKIPSDHYPFHLDAALFAEGQKLVSFFPANYSTKGVHRGMSELVIDLTQRPIPINSSNLFVALYLSDGFQLIAARSNGFLISEDVQNLDDCGSNGSDQTPVGFGEPAPPFFTIVSGGVTKQGERYSVMIEPLFLRNGRREKDRQDPSAKSQSNTKFRLVMKKKGRAVYEQPIAVMTLMSVSEHMYNSVLADEGSFVEVISELRDVPDELLIMREAKTIYSIGPFTNPLPSFHITCQQFKNDILQIQLAGADATEHLKWNIELVTPEKQELSWLYASPGVEEHYARFASDTVSFENNKLRANIGLLEVESDFMVRFAVSDGVRSVQAYSRVFHNSSSKPIDVEIMGPRERSVLEGAAAGILLVYVRSPGYSQEDDYTIRWYSDLDGEIGKGDEFSASYSLSIGTHKISAVATDKTGRKGQDEITLHVRPRN